MIGNGGLYIEPHSYTKVLDSEGAVVLTANTAPERVISAETSMILNKLCQEVVYGQYGTANSTAQIPGFTVAGKTGSASDNTDLWFVGMTPQYLGVCWLGYSEGMKEIKYSTYPTPIIWQSIMKKVMQGEDPNVKFPESANVVSATYCVASGDLAGPGCSETLTGWYKKDNLPGNCTRCYGVSNGIWDIPSFDDDKSDSGSGITDIFDQFFG
jgi:penicillin-binding protein 1A